MPMVLASVFLLVLCSDGRMLQAQEAKAPVPDAAAQKEIEATIKELFKSEYASKDLRQLRALANTLLTKGDETRDDPATRYVLLREAKDIAAKVGSVTTGLRATKLLIQSFELPSIETRLGFLNQVSKRVRDAEDARALARGYLSLATDAVEENDYDSATGAVRNATTSAQRAKNKALAARATLLQREMSSLKREYSKVKGALETPTAKTAEAVGKYRCLVQNDWDRGLKLLAQSSRASLKALAEKDLANPEDSKAQAEIGEGWWALAQKERSSWRKKNILTRARLWFERAHVDATGLSRVKIEKRLEDLEGLRPGFVNVFALIDPAKDAVKGSWKIDNGKVVSDNSDFSSLGIPYSPPEEYDFTVVFSRVSGNSDINLVLTKGGRGFVWVMGAGGRRCGFGRVNDMWVSDENPTIVDVPKPFEPGDTHTVTIEVRNSGLKVHLDGKMIRDWATDYGNLTITGAWKLRRDGTLGFASYKSPTAFLKAYVVEVTGSGKRLR